MLKRVLSLILLNVAAAVVTQTVADDLVIYPPSPPCGPGEVGFAGSYTDAGVTIKFWSCASSDSPVCHSKFMKATDDPISEVHNTTDSFKMFLAGVDISGDPTLTEEQLASIEAMFNSPEAALAEDIWGALDRLGMTIGSGGALTCLWLHSDLWERDALQLQGAACPDCNNHSKGCPGCCGKSSIFCRPTGCEGACTSECLAHDETCGSTPAVHTYLRSCREMLIAAASSALFCLDRKSGSGCGRKGQQPCDCCL